jgi:hypothetical protein
MVVAQPVVEITEDHLLNAVVLMAMWRTLMNCVRLATIPVQSVLLLNTIALFVQQKEPKNHIAIALMGHMKIKLIKVAKVYIISSICY